MDNSTLRYIMGVIDKDIKNRDVDGLIKIKEYIEKQIEDINLSNPEYSNYNKFRYILEMNFIQFILEYLKDNFKAGNNYRQFAIAVADIRAIQYNQIRVCDILGIEKSVFIDSYGVEEEVVDSVDKILKKYGLSLDVKLSNAEKELLRIVDEHITNY